MTRPEMLRLRARLNRHVRDFFEARGVLEVETPMLSRAGNTDPNIAPFALEFGGRTDGAPRTRWLRTSAEFPMKRLLAEGIGDCYELGRVFRDGEGGGRHNPEFTMLEWYRVGWTIEPLIDEAVAIVRGALALVGRDAIPRRTSFRALYHDTLALDPMTAPSRSCRRVPRPVDPADLTRDDWLDLLMTHQIQPTFPAGQLLAVDDYPASQCALARVVRRGDVEWRSASSSTSGRSSRQRLPRAHDARNSADASSATRRACGAWRGGATAGHCAAGRARRRHAAMRGCRPRNRPFLMAMAGTFHRRRAGLRVRTRLTARLLPTRRRRWIDPVHGRT